MNTERLLSLIRRSAAKRCTVERLLAAGWLTQLLGKHLEAGGEDNRKLLRRSLLRMGAPLKVFAKANRSARTKRNQRQVAFQKWTNRSQQKERERLGLASEGRQRPLGSRADYLGRMRNFKSAWQREGPFFVEESDDLSDMPPGNPDDVYRLRVGNTLWGLSSTTSPLDDALMTAELETLLPSSNKKQGGLTQRVKPVREAWRQSLYTKCVGDIPDQQKFPDVLPCGRKHPGICRVDLTEDMLRAHAVVCKKVADLEIGTVITLEATKGLRADGGSASAPLQLFKFAGRLAHAEGERWALFAFDLQADECLAVRSAQDCALYCTGEGVLLELWTRCCGSPLKVTLNFHGAFKPTCVGSAVMLAPPRLEPVVKHVTVWPIADLDVGESVEPDAPPSSASAFVRRMRETLAGFDSLPAQTPLQSGKRRVRRPPNEDDPVVESEQEDEDAINHFETKLSKLLQRKQGLAGARERKRKTGRMRARATKRKVSSSSQSVQVPVPPAPGLDVLAPGPSSSSSSSVPVPVPLALGLVVLAPGLSSSSSSSVQVPPVPVQPVPEPSQSLSLGKQKVADSWGREKWRVSRLKKGGYGAICNYHTNCYNQAKCKKEVSGHGLSNDDCRILIKKWLLLGVDISDHDAMGQKRHVIDVKLRGLLPVEDEQALDERAAGLT